MQSYQKSLKVISFISLFVDYWLDFEDIRKNGMLLAKYISSELMVNFRPLYQKNKLKSIKINIGIMKFTTNIKIDLALIPTFLLLIISGIGLHVTDEFTNYVVWHNWAVTHVIAGTLFLVLGIFHIKGHWPWFRSLAKSIKKKSKPNMILTLLFLFETVTGIILLAFIEGGGSHIGRWHWVVGLVMIVFGIGHLIKRWKTLKLGYAQLKK